MKARSHGFGPLVLSLLVFGAVSFWDEPLAQGGETGGETLLIKKAHQAFKEKKFILVTELLTSRLAELDKNEILILGKSYSELKNSLLAQKVYMTGLAKRPDDPDLKTLFGSEQFRGGKDKEALVTLKEVVDKNKNYLPAYQAMTPLFEKKKNTYELRLLYQDMIERFGEKYEFVSKLCELTTKDAHYELAIKYCALGTRLNPKEPNNLVYWGIALKDTLKLVEAEKSLRRAADSFSKSDLAQETLAHLLEEKKNYPDAFKYYLRAVSANPKSLSSQLGLAKNAFEIQKLEESLKAFGEACKLDRQSLPHFRRAIVTLKASKDEVWLKKFEAVADRCD